MKPCALPLLIALYLGQAACTQFPEFDERETQETRTAAFPDLLPIESLTQSGAPSRIDPQTQAVLEARVSNLRARAARLKRSVMDPNARNRLSQRPVVAEPS